MRNSAVSSAEIGTFGSSFGLPQRAPVACRRRCRFAIARRATSRLWDGPAFLPSCSRPVTRRTWMPSTQPFLAYRDRLGVKSEIGFLRRQYIGFTHLHPVWTGRILLPDALQLGAPLHRLGGNVLFGPLHRFLFRHFGRMPAMNLGGASVLHAQ